MTFQGNISNLAAELPPPDYEEVVASAPLPGRYNRLSRQDSLPKEAKERLIQEVNNLREQTLGYLSWLRNLTSDIDRSYTLLRSNRSIIEREIYEWKVHLTRLIDESYQQNMQSVSDGFDTLEHKLVMNREKVYKTYESARQLCWSMDERVSLKNHNTAQFMKRRFNEKLGEIKNITRHDVVPDQSISAWRFVKPEVLPEEVHCLGGKVWQPFMGSTDDSVTNESQPVESSVSATEQEANEEECVVDAGESGSHLTEAAVEDTSDQTESRPREISDTGDEKYTLLHTIQTKTFKDKARCHPISFAVDFDGNIIVADKFNKKLKIFTQRGQLFREITHPLLRSPAYLGLTLAGDIAVSDAESADVKFFSTDGVLLGNVPNLPNPCGLTFNLMGELLVTDTGQKAVHIVDTQLGVIKSSIQSYKDPNYPQQRYNYFQWPHYVTTGHNDEIMVTDRAAGNYQVFTSRGQYIGSVGKCGSGTGEFQDPYGISSYMGHGVIVADYSNNRVQRISSEGEFHEPILTSEDGLRFPTCAICTTDEKVLVSQYLTGEIKIFSRRKEHLELEEALPPSYTDVVGEAGGGAEPLPATFYNPPDDYEYGPQVAASREITRMPSWETSI